MGEGKQLFCLPSHRPHQGGWTPLLRRLQHTLYSPTTTHNNRKVPIVSLRFFSRLYTLLGGHAKDCAETVIMPIDDCVS
jgi:hypothetical protein